MLHHSYRQENDTYTKLQKVYFIPQLKIWSTDMTDFEAEKNRARKEDNGLSCLRFIFTGNFFYLRNNPHR